MATIKSEQYLVELSFGNFIQGHSSNPAKASLIGLRNLARTYVEYLVSFLETYKSDTFLGYEGKRVGNDINVVFKFKTQEAALEFGRLTKTREADVAASEAIAA